MMPEPASLAVAGNTYNPCLLILRQKGYELWAEESDDRLIWKASKERQAFMAYSPPELLGLVVLWGTYGKDWNQQQPNLVEEITAAGGDSERSEGDCVDPFQCGPKLRFAHVPDDSGSAARARLRFGLQC